MFKNKKLLLFATTLLVLLNVFIVLAVGRFVSPYFTMKIDLGLSVPQNIQVSYSTTKEANAETLVFTDFNQIGREGTANIEMKIPITAKLLRIDFGDLPKESAKIKNLSLNVLDDTLNLNKLLSRPIFEGNVKKIGSNSYSIKNIDPYIIYELDTAETQLFWNNTQSKRLFISIISCIVLDLIIALVAFICIRNKETKDLLKNRKTIWNLSKRDFKTKYAGSYLGIFWAFVQPIVTILLYWFVFQVGFRSAPTNGFPFVLWLISGLVPWFMFSDGITAVTNCLLEYSYLVKKVVFNIKMLPIVKIISALFVHIFFICFTLVIFMLNGYGFDMYIFQIIYYLIAMIALIIGLGLVTSAVIIFFRDLGQIVQICLQIGVWMTPIMWNLSMVGSKLQFLFKLNPTYYIVEGYRDCFINKVWFWEKPELTIYYWVIVTLIFWFATKIFKKLCAHFADVL